MPELSHTRHELFARTFVAHGASFGACGKAAREIGYDSSAARDALKLPQVRARIAELLEERHAELDISGRRVMQELAAISFAKISDLYDEDGDLIQPYNLPPHIAAAISGMDVEMRFDGRGPDAEPFAIRKYRFVDKNAALGILAKHFKIIGTGEDGVNALAAVLADKLKTARYRRYQEQDAEDATIIEPRPAAVPQPALLEQESDDERLW